MITSCHHWARSVLWKEVGKVESCVVERIAVDLWDRVVARPDLDQRFDVRRVESGHLGGVSCQFSSASAQPQFKRMEEGVEVTSKETFWPSCPAFFLYRANRNSSSPSLMGEAATMWKETEFRVCFCSGIL